MVRAFALDSVDKATHLLGFESVGFIFVDFL